jgi:ferredoxin
MTQPIYEKLVDAVNMRGFPGIKCPELYTLMEELFTPEEAELAVRMPLNPTSAADFASDIGRSAEGVERMLETMADEGLVFSHEQGGVKRYNLLPLVPGIFEFQFTKGEVNERAKKLARLFEDYFNVTKQQREKAGPSGDARIDPVISFARVITVEEEVPAGFEVYPYNLVSHYIENSEYLAASVCYCRHHGELVGNPCDKPKQNCMGLGPAAVFTARRGFGRLVSKEEALDIVKRAEEAGLVHCISNTGKYVDFICNCCTCHCGILRSLKGSDSPSMAATSSFIASLDKGDCSDCGDCVERCPMDALTIEGDVVTLDSNRCIGCGLCVSVCPTGAIRLELRERAPVPPRDRHELNAAMISSLR